MEKQFYTCRRLWTHTALALLLVVGFARKSIAQQVNTYIFAQSVGTYSPITGGTQFYNADYDDGSTNFTLPFTFNFGGNPYTNVWVCANGYVVFGGASDPTLGDWQNASVISGSLVNTGAIAAWAGDLSGWVGTVGSQNSEVRGEVIGTAPNRTAVFQWISRPAYSTSTTSVAYLSFQIKLQEGTDVVSIVYGSAGQIAGTGNTNGARQVGLRGATNAVYLNRSNATTVSFNSSVAGTNNAATQALSTINVTPGLPTNGLTYTYTPPTPALPTVATGSFSNITSSTVSLTGSVGAINFPSVTASGIVLATTPNPTVGGFGVIDSATNPVITAGAIAKNITGLMNGTTYYYRTYATNSVGTAYGADSTFTTNASAVIPSINRIAATNVTNTTATLGGNVINNGGSAIIASGVVYCSANNGVPSLFGAGVVDSTTNPLVDLGAYNFNLQGLTPNTKYYYRAYATNSVGVAYSNLDSFNTDPIITYFPYAQNFDTLGLNTGWKTASVNGGSNSWELGTPAKTNLSNAFSAPNSFVTRLTGSYSGGDDCAIVSPQLDFTGINVDPVLRFAHEMDVDNDLNYDGGVVEISINGGAWTRLDATTGTAPTYNTVNSTAWYNNNSTLGPLGSPKWSVNTATSYPNHVNGWITSSTSLTGAAGQSNVRVRLRFAADGVVDEGWAVDNIEIFSANTPTAATGTKANVTTSAATLYGNVTGNGGNPVSESGIVIGTSPNPTRGTFGVIDSASNPVVKAGAFTISVAGLNSATTYYYRAYATNGIGTSYGADSTFVTLSAATVPQITRIAASNVTAFNASVGGNITSDGGSAVIASGIVYATTHLPALFGVGVVDSTTNPVKTSGSFTINPSGLMHSTKYYYRAYATNSVGTGYSVEDSFVTEPVVNTLPYSQNFDLVGVVTGWNSAPVTGTDNDWVLGTPAKAYINGAFSAPNAFVTKLTGNYFGSDCAVQSPQFDFTGISATPVLRFKHKFDTDADANYDGGVVEISINGGAWTKLDAIQGTGANFNTAQSTAWYNNNSVNGPLGAPKFSNLSSAYSSQANGWITSLTPLTGAAGQSNVKVRFRFGADIFGTDEGWAIDNIEVFEPSAPTVVTGTNTNVTTNLATLSGNITNNGGNSVTASGIVFSTSPAPTRGSFGVADSSTNPLIGVGSFTINLAGLMPATTYYYRAYAVNTVGTSYGADSSFITPSSAILPTVLNLPATSITQTSAVVGGNITSDGGSAVFASGVLYSSSTNNLTIGNFGVVDSATNPAVASGVFNINPAGLTHSTKYYYRAYATNSVGTAYAVLDSFYTMPIISVLPYTENFDASTTPWVASAINTGTNAWVRGTPAKTNLNGAHSAPNSFVTFLTGNYSGTEDCAILSPQFDFTAYSQDPILRFYHKMDVDADPGYDGGVIEISINGGAWTRLDNTSGSGGNYNTLNSYSWYNDGQNLGTLGANKFSENLGLVYSSQVSGWIQSATRLTGAGGQSNVRVRFRFWADIYTDEGWAIDDIEVINVLTPTVASSNVTATPSNTSANVSFSPGNGEGRLVVARLSTATAVAPFDTVMYTSNAAYGSGSTTGAGNFVVYVGTGTSVNVTNLASLTGYSFDVYEFNGKYMHNKFASSSLGSTTTTPVKLLNFVAVKKSTDGVLSWVTASEVNNKGFEVERSTDGKTFEAIDFVFGKGNSNSKVSYSYTDARVFSQGISKVYYRLKQVDNDGKYSYSSVVMLMNDLATSTQISAYPNPFTTEVTVSVVSAKAGQASVEVYDISGRKVLSNQYDVVEGNNALHVTELNQLHTGIYFVKVQVDGQEKVIKMAKN